VVCEEISNGTEKFIDQPLRTMTMKTVQRTTSLTILSAALFASSAAFGSIVYDNSTTDLNRSYAPASGVEFGDEVFLSGTDRTITDFRFETFLSAGASGNETGQLFFYLNDGAAGAPGTELYRSSVFALESLRRTVVASGLSVALPGGANNFTWTVKLSGVEGGESAGLLLFNPPTNGSSFDDFWQKNGATWQTQTIVVDGALVPANFAARITAVPEPSTFALGLAGAASLIGYLRFRRQS
jgi:PEP-CTERM motif